MINIKQMWRLFYRFSWSIIKCSIEWIFSEMYCEWRFDVHLRQSFNPNATWQIHIWNKQYDKYSTKRMRFIDWNLSSRFNLIFYKYTNQATPHIRSNFVFYSKEFGFRGTNHRMSVYKTQKSFSKCLCTFSNENWI